MLKKEGYEGCEILKGQRARKQVVYVCWRQDGSTIPTFYHYDRAKYRQENQGKLANKIVGVTYKTSNLATLQFEGGSVENLSSPHVWMGRWRSKGEVKPETECKFEKLITGRSSYKLTCSSYTVQSDINFTTDIYVRPSK